MRTTSDAKSRQSTRRPSIYPQVAGLLVAVALILFIVVGVSMRGGEDAEPLRPILLATGDWAPYSGEKLAQSGIASAVVSAVFQQMGYRPEFRFMPWPRVEQATLESESNRGVRGAFPYALNAERRVNFYYSQPIFEIELSVFYAKNRNPRAATIGALADLADFQIVPIGGYRYSAEIEKRFASMAPVANNVAAFRMLLQSDRPLLVVEATRVGQEILREELALHADEIETAALKVSSPIHLIVSKRNPDNSSLVKKFDETLLKIQRDGSLKQISAQALDAIDAQRTVRLQPVDSQGRIQAFASADASFALLLPHGTRAVVERWSKNFLQEKAAAPPTRELVKIRVLNGPQRGRSVYVDERAIVLP